MFRLLIALLISIIGLSPASALAKKLFPSPQVKMIYVTNCAECHGAKGRGSEEGPSLHYNEFIKKSSPDVIKKILVEGISEDKKRYKEFAAGMESYKENLSREDIQNLAALMKSWNQ